MLDTSCQMPGPQFFQPGSPTSAARSANSRHRATWLAGWPSIYRAEKAGRDLTLLARTQKNLISRSSSQYRRVWTTRVNISCENDTTILKNYNYFSLLAWFSSHTMPFVSDPSFSLCRDLAPFQCELGKGTAVLSSVWNCRFICRWTSVLENPLMRKWARLVNFWKHFLFNRSWDHLWKVETLVPISIPFLQ